MSIASTIAVSGMNAAALRLQVSASNVANAESGGPLPGAANAAGYPAAYNALTVDQTAMADGSTRATVAVATPGTVLAYDPTAPYADAQGMVAAPNVDFRPNSSSKYWRATALRPTPRSAHRRANVGVAVEHHGVIAFFSLGALAGRLGDRVDAISARSPALSAFAGFRAYRHGALSPPSHCPKRW